MNEDRIKGTAKKAVGKAQAKIGEVVANDQLEAKGRINQAVGTVQEGYGKVRDKVRDLIDEAPTTARDAVDTGRDYYRRGSAAVTRTMGDNTGLVLLAAGAAGAALGWLMFNRRKKSKGK
jgi:uncharacterized protein YjbJ (UPF0337 family)